MDRAEIAEVTRRPIAQELLGSAIPARLAYTGLDGDPRVVPIAFVWNGAALVLHTVPASAKVRGLYDEMVRVTIEPDWAKLLDFVTTLPKAVADLVHAKFGTPPDPHGRRDSD
jgi:hypothetical protein